MSSFASARTERDIVYVIHIEKRARVQNWGTLVLNQRCRIWRVCFVHCPGGAEMFTPRATYSTRLKDAAEKKRARARMLN